MDYSYDCKQHKMLQHALLRAHAGVTHYTDITSAPLVTLRQRIRFKLVWFVFQSLAGLAPPYFADDCRLVSLTDRHLHSADTRTCVVPQTNIRFGDRSFSTSGPKIWNGLPSALSFAVFKQRLKSYLFNAI